MFGRSTERQSIPIENRTRSMGVSTLSLKGHFDGLDVIKRGNGYGLAEMSSLMIAATRHQKFAPTTEIKNKLKKGDKNDCNLNVFRDMYANLGASWCSIRDAYDSGVTRERGRCV